ncbi:MAG: tRNA (N6-isopentenyl adenosine(37)-C2)-methylthiotransferase MiaB [Syntrophorhabdaceae bacterium]|nr:tRNA (N6-isopentenyl adenosine(37)-C2)-methylthiotransferase MiaB [Syntrophorhabdaceae bacterium]
MNIVDSGRMMSLMAAEGYAVASSLEEADIVLLNTCSIREKADQKAYSELGALRRWKRSRDGRIIGVGGCLAQQAADALRKRAPHVDVVFGTHNIARLPELIRNAKRRSLAAEEILPDGEPSHWDVTPWLPEGSFSTMTTIMQGCDNFCAYCIVPYVRGREVSRPSESVISEIRSFAKRGVREIVLLGQNVNSYGKKEGETPFFELLRRVSRVEGISRIRFITSHPRDLDERTIALFSEIEALCPHIHLPLQSGSDRMLEAMGRGYTARDYMAKIEALKKARPGIAFSSDFIVGFPGETEDDFQETLAIMKAVKYDSAFSFCFSARPGSRAAEMGNRVDPAVAARRLKQLQALQDQHSLERLESFVGKTVEVLLEGSSARNPNDLCGRTPCFKMVNFAPTGGAGPLRAVTVSAAGRHSLSGKESQQC